jgi:hypothetical protein
MRREIAGSSGEAQRAAERAALLKQEIATAKTRPAFPKGTNRSQESGDDEATTDKLALADFAFMPAGAQGTPTRRFDSGKLQKGDTLVVTGTNFLDDEIALKQNEEMELLDDDMTEEVDMPEMFKDTQVIRPPQLARETGSQYQVKEGKVKRKELEISPDLDEDDFSDNTEVTQATAMPEGFTDTNALFDKQSDKQKAEEEIKSIQAGLDSVAKMAIPPEQAKAHLRQVKAEKAAQLVVEKRQLESESQERRRHAAETHSKQMAAMELAKLRKDLTTVKTKESMVTAASSEEAKGGAKNLREAEAQRAQEEYVAAYKEFNPSISSQEDDIIAITKPPRFTLPWKMGKLKELKLLFEVAQAAIKNAGEKEEPVGSDTESALREAKVAYADAYANFDRKTVDKILKGKKDKDLETAYNTLLNTPPPASAGLTPKGAELIRLYKELQEAAGNSRG